MLLRLHHAQITIPLGAEDQARTFYCQVLGMEEIAKPQSLSSRGGLWLKLGDIQIHVGTEQGVDRCATKAHLAYEVHDLAHWRKVLTDRGVQIEQCVAIPGYERFEFRDPFGNRVEMLQRIG